MGTVTANNLTPKQEKAIAALLSEPTVLKAAEVAGVNDRTLYRWLDEPAFADAFRKARREAFTHAVSLSQKYAPMALNNLAVISNDKTAPHSARVAASKAVLDYGRESIELDDVVHRLRRLEENAEAAKAKENTTGAWNGGGA